MTTANVRDYGAVGDGVTDDSAAILAAWNAVRATSPGGLGGGTVLLPSGRYGLSTPLTFSLAHGVCFTGEGAEGEEPATSLVWNGPANGTPLALIGLRDARFEHFSIRPGMSPIGTALQIDQSTPTAAPSTHLRFRDIGIGASTIGVDLSPTCTHNNDLHTFEDVYIHGPGWCGYRLGNGQSKQHKIMGGSIGLRACALNVQAGSLHAYGLNIDNCPLLLNIEAVADTITLLGCCGEGISRLVNTAASSNAHAVTVEGGRFQYLPSASGFVEWKRAGCLTLIGNDFANGTPIPTFWLNLAGTNGNPCTFIGNVFPNATPFREVGPATRLVALGNSYIGSGGEGRALPNVL